MDGNYRAEHRCLQAGCVLSSDPFITCTRGCRLRALHPKVDGLDVTPLRAWGRQAVWVRAEAGVRGDAWCVGDVGVGLFRWNMGNHQGQQRGM